MLEIVFVAGRPVEGKKLVSSTTAPLLREGAGPLDGETFNEQIDYYGATFSVNAGMDAVTLKIVCLSKHLSSVVRIVSYALSQPWFSPKELESYVARRIDKMKVDLVKNDIICYRELTEGMFGADHAYGYNSTEELYSALQVDDLKNFYYGHLHSGNCYIFISGDVKDAHYMDVQYLSDHIPTGSPSVLDASKLDRKPILEQKRIISGAKNQCSIRLGAFACRRDSEEYLGMLYLTTLLGGYFGSRLTSNLREDKGLTYGISASLDAQLHDGLLVISTEVANDQVDLCLREIYKEMDLLKSKKTSQKEILQVNNYLLGLFINLFDGPFNSIRAIKSLVLSHNSLDDLQLLIEASISFNQKDIQALAQTYLNRENFWEVIVGEPKK